MIPISPEALDSPTLLAESALELEVRDVMTTRVLNVPDDAMLQEAIDLMGAYWIHGILVVGRRTGTPLGWVTTRGLLGLIGIDGGTPVTEAITEEAKAIEPTASLRSAIYALSFPSMTRLLVRRREETEPEGVVTDYDLTVRATRLS
jgi:predicted transcriptional regulator